MNTKQALQALAPLALGLGIVACGSQQTPQPQEAQIPAPVEAYAAPQSGPIVPPATPVAPDQRTSMATPQTSPRRSAEPVVETSGPLSEPQRVVLSTVATCLQRGVDKGEKLGKKSLIVNVTVEPSGAVSAVDLDGGGAKLKSCAYPEILKVRYPSTDDSAGIRVMQYPMDASLQDASTNDE